MNNRFWNKFMAIEGTSFDLIQTEINTNFQSTETQQKIIQHWKAYPGSIGCYFSHIKL